MHFQVTKSAFDGLADIDVNFNVKVEKRKLNMMVFGYTLCWNHSIQPQPVLKADSL